MLILTRKPGESVYIGDDIKITIVEIKGHQIRVGIDAPKEMRIYREEIYIQILEENKQAAAAALSGDEGLEGLSEAWGSRKSPSSAEGKHSPSASITARAPSASGDPQVLVKRRKKKKEDEQN